MVLSPDDIDQIKRLFWGLTYGLPRLAATFWTLPFLGGGIVPPLVRNACLLAVLAALYPLIAPAVPSEKLSLLFIVFIVIKEAFVGFLMGFVICVIFWAVQSAGAYLDMQRGAFGHQGQNPLADMESTPAGNVLFLLATALFFISGGFLELIGCVAHSYRIWPIATFVPDINADAVLFMGQQADKLSRLCLVIAAPVLIPCFLADLGMAIMNRFAPQLNVFVVTMSIKSGLSLLIWLLCIEFTLAHIKGEFMMGSRALDLLRAVLP